MPYLHDHKLFISHAWKYSDRYERAVNFLNAASNFKWSNYSVPEDKAFEGMSSGELGEQIKRQIRPVQCVVIVSGMYVNHSGWIQYEMDFAKQIGKPILGIKRWGGRTIGEALKRAEREKMLCSFDMLGEGARTAEDAERYAKIYAEAIATVGEAAAGSGPEDGHGVSVKLSALCPRYEAVQEARVWDELYPRVKELALITATFSDSATRSAVL